MPQSDYPSTVIEAACPGVSEPCTVLIPEKERFRIRNIFHNQEYGIPSDYLPRGSITVVDIGANVGLFTLYIKNIREDSDIHCFEPVPQSLALLQQNIKDRERIKVYPYALANYEGTADLNLHIHNSGENSLKKGAGHQGDTIAVQVMAAANAFRQIGLTYIDILKIDTEGCECEILESLQAYLPYVGIFMAEYHSEKDRRRIDDLLQEHTLFDANICNPGTGIVKYINSRLL